MRRVAALMAVVIMGLLVAGPVQGAAADPGPTMSTDKELYDPFTDITVSGTGCLPIGDEPVQVILAVIWDQEQGTGDRGTLFVQPAADGSWSKSFDINYAHEVHVHGICDQYVDSFRYPMVTVYAESSSDDFPPAATIGDPVLSGCSVSVPVTWQSTHYYQVAPVITDVAAGTTGTERVIGPFDHPTTFTWPISADALAASPAGFEVLSVDGAVLDSVPWSALPAAAVDSCLAAPTGTAGTGAGGPSLAATGSPVGSMLGFAGVAALLGGSLLVLARRRQVH
ncbi:hypothetical protein GIS00_06005 [Nakamurella sp. YIM 132087]|uniref:LPXTG cell wall anchor domain-containing protein n=1 Tax=Nakamurella alba TaxID=2665158 RepID=A0A7K1FHF5_9ACTN|nr:hypothetical protein [Nakamurella alba]MTD13496.1 hypothetical protein [Nakamurella alba]